MPRIVEIARSLNFDTRPLRLELQQIPKLALPCILHWDLNHFVVLNHVTKKNAQIYDPGCGIRSLSLADLSKHFTGVAVEIMPTASFSQGNDTSPIFLRSLTGPIIGLKRALLQGLCLIIGIEIISLVLPFQVQWVIDQVLTSGDTRLLILIMFAFLILMAMQTFLSVARGLIISWLGATVSAQWVTNLFNHLLKLPIDFFEKRHIGDIISRFDSVRSIQNTLTGKFIESLLDGLMGSLALIILAIYSLPLTLVVVITFVIYMVLRWMSFGRLRNINEEHLILTARQQTELMESVRGIQTVKLANKQAERRARLENVTLDAAERDMQKQRINLGFAAINRGLFGTQRILLVSIGAAFCIKGSFSAGMLVAYLVYVDQFNSKVSRLVDSWVDFRMLRLHAERIADIALTAPEEETQAASGFSLENAHIEVRNVSFRYACSDPWILRNINIIFKENDFVAVTGPSGCGKSTLAKIILGLLEPTVGNVLINGIDIKICGLQNYRKIVGAVLQEDQLFAGSIADNIAFFDPEATNADVESAAKAAAVHNTIMSMPMRYESLVGDMGSALSGGEKQRILLARAFYRKPKLLVLDEATSHLDRDNEDLVNKAINAADAIRIVIAHRSETISRADKIFDMRTENFLNSPNDMIS